MDSDPTGTDTATDANKQDDERLVALLSCLRVKATPEAHFEERFLHDLHERIEREFVCRPARLLLWEHIAQFIAGWGHRKWAYSATALCMTILGISYVTWPAGEEGGAMAGAEASLTNRLEATLSSLKPGSAREVTRISVGKSASRTQLSSFRSHVRPIAATDEENEVAEWDAAEEEQTPYSRFYRSHSRPGNAINVGLPSDRNVQVLEGSFTY